MNEIVENELNEDGPWDGKRYEIIGLNNRKQYVIVDDEGIVVTFPDNLRENWNYQSTATALARMISVARNAGIDMEYIKKQLEHSSAQKGDTPDVILQAIQKYEGKNENK